jgi:mannose-6-phosphate isomerase-like protein (cupin superfamily)
VDRQQPHDRDELYVIISGSGRFRSGASERDVVPGEVLFVPAWVEHRFVDFSPDFATWVFFVGPPKERRR